jgi:hypothetical protein
MKSEKSMKELFEIAGIKDIDSALSLITEASSSAGWADWNDTLRDALQIILIGKELTRVTLSDPSSAVIIKKVSYNSFNDNGTLLIIYDKTIDWHPLREHKEYQEGMLKKIKNFLPKGSKVGGYESQNYQSQGMIGIDGVKVKAQYPGNYVGGLLSNVKDKVPVIVGVKASEQLLQAAKIVNHGIKQNKSVLSVQEELIDNDLKDFAEL